MLTIMVVAFMAKGAAVDGIMAAKGKDPASLQKFRERAGSGSTSGRGGGAKSSRSQPKKPRGALAEFFVGVKDAAAREALARSQHKWDRRRAWYEEQAPRRDEKWRQKHARRIELGEKAAAAFAKRKGLVSKSPDKQKGPVVPGGGPAAEAKPERPSAAGNADPGRATGDPENPAPAKKPTGTAGVSPDPVTTSDPERLPVEPSTAPESSPAPTGERALAAVPDPAPTNTSTTATTTTGDNVYEQGVMELQAAVAEIEGYRADLAMFADQLGGKGWGHEVTGDVADMDGALAAIAQTYSDLAEQIKTQGDATADAYEAAPWVPSREAALA